MQMNTISVSIRNRLKVAAGANGDLILPIARSCLGPGFCSARHLVSIFHESHFTQMRVIAVNGVLYIAATSNLSISHVGEDNAQLTNQRNLLA